MGAGGLGAAVRVVGAESLFGWVGVRACTGGVGRAAAGGGVACAWVGGWWARWGTSGVGVGGGGGTVPGGLFGMDVYVKPVRAVSEW